MYKKFVLLALAVPFFLTGCWDKKDPEDRAFIITLGADAAENGCHFTFAPANIETGEAEIYAAESETLSGAVAQVDTYTSRKTDLGQLKTVILGEGLLRDSARLDALLGELERSQAVSEKVMLLAADSAAACVEKAMKEDSKTGLFLWDFYKNTAEEVAVTKGIDLDTFLTERTERGGNGVLPRIRAEGERLRLGGGMAVSARGASILNEEEERGYLFLLGDAEGAVLEGRYKAAVLPLAVTKIKGGLRFSGGRGHRSLHRDASRRGNLARRQGRIAFRGTENGVGEYFFRKHKGGSGAYDKNSVVRRGGFPRYSAEGRARPAAACQKPAHESSFGSGWRFALSRRCRLRIWGASVD